MKRNGKNQEEIAEIKTSTEIMPKAKAKIIEFNNEDIFDCPWKKNCHIYYQKLIQKILPELWKERDKMISVPSSVIISVDDFLKCLEEKYDKK